MKMKTSVFFYLVEFSFFFCGIVFVSDVSESDSISHKKAAAERISLREML